MITTQLLLTAYNKDRTWFKNLSLNFKEGQDVSDNMAIIKAKELMGWDELRCKRTIDHDIDSITLSPYKTDKEMIIDFHYFGSCS